MSSKSAPVQKKPFLTTKSFFTILVIALILNVIINQFRDPPAAPAAVVELTPTLKSFTVGKRVEMVLTNRTDTEVKLLDDCPNEPFTIERKEGDAWVPRTATAEHVTCPTLPDTLAPGAKQKVTFSAWNTTLFDAPGLYRATVTLAPESSQMVAPLEFQIKERSWISNVFLTILYRPIYNALIWLISLMGMNLGFAIIVLTLLVRGLLFIPTYRSLSHQAELQALQPELEKIKKRHATDKEKQAQATMALYKERGVNPLGSCLPLLVQLPVLWAMYYVLRDGVDAANHALLYAPLQHIDLSQVQSVFAGIDLLVPKNIIIAVIGFALQFLSMKLITWTLPKEVRASQAGGQAATMNMFMTYILPVFVGWLSYTYPAGLGLYWATSTLFGIGQQLVLKRARESQAAQRMTKAQGGEIKDAEFREKS